MADKGSVSKDQNHPPDEGEKLIPGVHYHSFQERPLLELPNNEVQKVLESQSAAGMDARLAYYMQHDYQHNGNTLARIGIKAMQKELARREKKSK